MNVEQLKQLVESYFQLAIPPVKIITLEEALKLKETKKLAEQLVNSPATYFLYNAVPVRGERTFYIIVIGHIDYSTIVHELLHYTLEKRFPKIYVGKIMPNLNKEEKLCYYSRETWTEAFTYLFTFEFINPRLAEKRFESYLLTNLIFAVGDYLGILYREKYGKNAIKELISQLEKSEKLNKFVKELEAELRKAIREVCAFK